MVHAMWFSNVFCSCILGNSAETGPGVQAKATMSRLESIREILDIIFRGGGQDHAKYYRVSFSSVLCISLIAFLHSFSLCVHPMKLFPPNPLYLYLQHNDCIFYCTLTTILNLSSFMWMNVSKHLEMPWKFWVSSKLICNIYVLYMNGKVCNPWYSLLLNMSCMHNIIPLTSSRYTWLFEGNYTCHTWFISLLNFKRHS